MPKFDLQIKGIKKLQDRMEQLIPAIRQEVGSEVYLFGEEVMEASKEVVPVDTGTLMGSGHVEWHPNYPAGGKEPFTFEGRPVEKGDDEILVTVGYGGPARAYALSVHENFDLGLGGMGLGRVIGWSRPGSGPKYLENPLKERQDQLPKRVSAAVRDVINQIKRS